MLEKPKRPYEGIVVFVPTLGLQLDAFAAHYEGILAKTGVTFEPVIAPFIDISRQRICQLAAERCYPRAYMLDDDVLLGEVEFSHFIEATLPVDFITYPFKGNRGQVTAGDFSSDRFPIHTFPAPELFHPIPNRSYLYSDWCGAGAMSIRADYLHTGLFFELTKMASPFSGAHVVRYGEDVSYCMHMRLYAPYIFWREYEERVLAICPDYPTHSRKFLIHYSPGVQHLDRFLLAGCSNVLTQRSNHEK